MNRAAAVTEAAAALRQAGRLPLRISVLLDGQVHRVADLIAQHEGKPLHGERAAERRRPRGLLPGVQP